MTEAETIEWMAGRLAAKIDNNGGAVVLSPEPPRALPDGRPLSNAQRDEMRDRSFGAIEALNARRPLDVTEMDDDTLVVRWAPSLD